MPTSEDIFQKEYIIQQKNEASWNDNIEEFFKKVKRIKLRKFKMEL